MRGQILVDGKRPDEWLAPEQGFIDQWGVFMTRDEAWGIAKSAQQIKFMPERPPGPLFSEDLY